MLLAIDVGNTNITMGLFKNSHLLKRYSIPTKTKKLFFVIKQIFSKNDIDNAIICSVVPKVAKIIDQYIKRLLGKQPYILGKNIRVPIKNLYKKPRQVGQDRLVAAYAAAKIYGTPVIVVDFGTATTFDVVSKRGDYLGGIIFPGIGMSLQALNEKTALLPKVKLGKTSKIIGKDTVESILSGIHFGYGSLVDGLVTKISKRLMLKFTIIFTGGFAKTECIYGTKYHKIDTNLILKGLQLIISNRVI